MPLPSNKRPMLRTFACAGMCLPTRCLAVGIHVTLCYTVTIKTMSLNSRKYFALI
jgi:hypothetical protein